MWSDTPAYRLILEVHDTARAATVDVISFRVDRYNYNHAEDLSLIDSSEDAIQKGLGNAILHASVTATIHVTDKKLHKSELFSAFRNHWCTAFHN